jgi:hypothetical protein
MGSALAIDPAVPIVSRSSPRSDHREVFVLVVAAAVTVPSGAIIGHGMAIQFIVLIGLITGFVLGIVDWRRSIYGLLAYLPFSGVASVLLYPRVAPAVLVKDLLFIIPAYVGCLVRHISTKQSISYGGASSWLLGSFAVLVLGQAFNPSLPNRIVGAIGAKVWLFYIPLCFLGYHLIRDRRELHRFLRIMSIAAIVPALIGIGEAVLVYAGHDALVYRAYGQAAATTTQNFAQFNFVGGGTLRRIPSTFSFAGQYFSFTAIMVAVTYAWWRGSLIRTRAAPFGFALWMVLVLAAFLSGARGAFVSIPLLMLLIILLERRGRTLPIRWAIAPIALLICSAAVLRANIAAVMGHTVEVLTAEFQDVFLEGFRSAISLTLIGLGAGIDTNGARYAFPEAGQFTFVGGTWYESWYVKALLELGLLGLILLVASLTSVTIGALRRHLRIHDARFRAVSASLLAVIVWNIGYGIKGGLIDIDPMNVYFWFFVGVLAKIATLDERSLAASQGDVGE